MAQFIHLTDEKLLAKIKRSGISPSKIGNSNEKVLFATPVLDNFFLSHQWVRELRRTGVKLIAAIQFRIDDDEAVKVGHYMEELLATTAAKAVQIFRDHKTGLGLQILIPRKIKTKEIVRIYIPTQVAGWRYYPESHGKKPCGCDYCQRGQIKSRKLREDYERAQPVLAVRK